MGQNDRYRGHLQATERLIDEAIICYGNSARDIYYYLRTPSLCNVLHKQHDEDKWPLAIHFLKVYEQTGEALMMQHQRSSETRLSHRLCALTLSPRKEWEWWASDHFEVTWKSERIKKTMENLVEKMELAKRAKLFNLLSAHGKGHSFAGNLYEPFAHQILSSPQTFLQLQPMKCISNSDGELGNVFTFETTSTVYSRYEELPKVSRSMFIYAKLPRSAQLAFDLYYIPKSTNNPFFDSFFFWNLDNYVILVVVQITSGQTGHKKVTLDGLLIIIELKARAQDAFKKDVEVMYLFVTPDISLLKSRDSDGDPPTWAILSDYFKPPICRKLKFSGRVFFLGVPLPYDGVCNARVQLSFLAKSENAEIHNNVITKARGQPAGSASSRHPTSVNPPLSTKRSASSIARPTKRPRLP
jgi:hypothetical protein